MQALVNNKSEQTESEPNSRIDRKKLGNDQKIKIRLVPLWARIIIVLVLTMMALVGGAMVGYSVMGDGKAMDVFKKSTWTHIVDLVNKDTTENKEK